MRSIGLPMMVVLLALGLGCPPKDGSGTTMRVYGVTPGEILLPGELWIRGRNLDKATSVTFRSLSSPQITIDGQILEKEPSGLRVAVPHTQAVGSRRFEAAVVENDAVAPGVFTGANRVRFVDTGASQPKGEMQFQFVAASWSFDCDAAGNNCSPSGYLGVATWPYPEGWTQDPFWMDWKMHVDQAARDWALGCSDAFTATHSYGIRPSFREKVPRQHLVWNDLYWFETAPDADDADLHQVASGHLIWTASDGQGNLVGQDLGSFCNLGPGFCSQPFVGRRSDTVVVVNVGRMDFFGVEIDPTDPDFGSRAITNPPILPKPAIGLPAYDTRGIIIVSDNPGRNSRPHPSETANDSVQPLIAGINACNAETCWWGPGKSIDSTPNLLAHELAHLFTGFAEVDTSKFGGEVVDTFLVGADKDDGGNVRRGFKLAIPFYGNTAEQACQWAHEGTNTPGDYVH